MRDAYALTQLRVHRQPGYLLVQHPLAGPGDRQDPQQIWVDLVSGSGPGCPPLLIDRFDPHQTHQPLNPIAVAAEDPGHPAASIEGRLEILFVDRAHQGQMLGRLAVDRVVPAGPRQPHQLASARDAQFGMFGVDASTTLFN